MYLFILFISINDDDDQCIYISYPYQVMMIIDMSISSNDDNQYVHITISSNDDDKCILISYHDHWFVYEVFEIGVDYIIVLLILCLYLISISSNDDNQYFHITISSNDDDQCILIIFCLYLVSISSNDDNQYVYIHIKQ
jgi:hypothetical protein